MPKITLKETWTHRTPLVTTEYPAGTHTVDDDVAEAAEAAGVFKGTSDGNGTAKAAKAGAADDAESE